MAKINIITHEHEKRAVIKAIKKHEGKTIAVSKIAKEADINPNRARFVIEDLIAEDRIERIVTKKFNERYIRYSYKVKE